MNAESFKRGFALSIIITAVCAAVSVLFAAEAFASLYLRVIILLLAFLISALFNLFQIMRLHAVIKVQEEKLEMSERRYRIFDEFSENVHFDADIAEARITFNSNFECLFGQKPGIEKLSDWRSLLSFIVLEDLPEVIRAWENALRGCQQSSSDIRVVDADRQVLWFRLSLVAQFDKNGEAVRMLGRLSSIDAEVRRMKRQRLKAMLDPLTHLYHRAAAEELVDELLKGEGKRCRHAMLIIEIENIKAIGDGLLVDFSKMLRKVFRSSDILGRVGAGKFMVFLRDIPGDYIVEYKTLNLLKAVNSLNAERQCEPINCGIGAAFYGSGCSCFTELYDFAEKSLDDKKFNEKNSISFFPAQDIKKKAAF